MPAELAVDQLRCGTGPRVAWLGPSLPSAQQLRLRSGPSLAPRLSYRPQPRWAWPCILLGPALAGAQQGCGHAGGDTALPTPPSSWLPQPHRAPPARGAVEASHSYRIIPYYFYNVLERLYTHILFSITIGRCVISLTLHVRLDWKAPNVCSSWINQFYTQSSEIFDFPRLTEQ